VKRKHSTPIMARVNNGVHTKIETTVGTLMVNPIRMVIRKIIFIEKEVFIKGEL
jgi:hypothetical protein